MLWQFKQNYKRKVLAKIYKIEPLLLDSKNLIQWTNLGLWRDSSIDYIQAAQRLAQHMGESLQLDGQDSVLDVGCGYGASLRLWHDDFYVKQCDALELQPNCCDYIKIYYPNVQNIFEQSIFDPKPKGFAPLYDVILSVDATYHYAIKDYLQALEAWLNRDGRIGFHSLIKSPKIKTCSDLAWQDITKKLRYAKVSAQDLMTEDQLHDLLSEYAYQQVKIKDMTKDVLGGFSDFILSQKSWQLKERRQLGFLKIYLTAKLCESLVKSGLIQYVQVTASKK